MPRVLFINRSYFPDAEATGQLLTELCEDLSGSFDITVLSGKPNQNPEGHAYRSTGEEMRNGVTIRRVRHTQFAKRSFVGRALNQISFLIAATFVSLFGKRPDVVVVETDPPLLCLLGGLLRWRFSTRLVVYLQDIYPDIAVALGKLSDGWLTRWLRRLFFRVYRTADRVVVLSEDMRDVMIQGGVSVDRISIVPNWVDTTIVKPIKEANAFRVKQGLDDKFVAMYSGNLGLCQDFVTILKAAKELRSREDIIFLFIGDGAQKQDLVAQAASLPQVRFLDYRPKSELSQSLSAADLHLIPVDERIRKYLMPSKFYGILAAATPVIVVSPADTELVRIVEANELGGTVRSGEHVELANKIKWFADECTNRTGFGQRARTLVMERYDRRICTKQFGELLGEVASSTSSSGRA